MLVVLIVVLLVVLAGAAFTIYLLVRARSGAFDPDIPIRSHVGQHVDAEQLAVAGALIFRGPTFRHRTVRKLVLLSPNEVRHSTSLDFTVPETSASNRAEADANADVDERRGEPLTTLVPLVMVTKGKLADIDLHDECGTAVPILNRAEESEVSTLLLRTLAGKTFGKELWQDEEFEGNIYRLVAAQAEFDAEVAYYDVLGRLTLDENDVEYENKLRVIDILRSFIANAQTYAVVPRIEPGSRHVLKLAFTSEAPWRETKLATIVGGTLQQRFDEWTERIAAASDPHHAQQLDLRRRGREAECARRGPQRRRSDVGDKLRGWIRGWTSRLGITSWRVVSEFAVVDAQSEHLEIEAPPGTYLTGGSLVTRARESNTTVRLDEVPRGSRRAHLYSPYGSNTGERKFAVRMRVLRRGWLLSATASTVVASLILWLAFLRRDSLRPGTASQLVAVAVGTATIAVVYLARPSEHALTTRLLEGPRIALGVTALALLAAALLLAFHDPAAPPTDDETLRWLSYDHYGSAPAAASTGAAALLLANYAGGVVGRFGGPAVDNVRRALDVMREQGLRSLVVIILNTRPRRGDLPHGSSRRQNGN